MENNKLNEILGQLQAITDNVPVEQAKDEHFCIDLLYQLLKYGYAERARASLQQLTHFMADLLEEQSKINEIEGLIVADFNESSSENLSFEDQQTLRLELIGNLL